MLGGCHNANNATAQIPVKKNLELENRLDEYLKAHAISTIAMDGLAEASTSNPVQLHPSKLCRSARLTTPIGEPRSVDIKWSLPIARWDPWVASDIGKDSYPDQ